MDRTEWHFGETPVNILVMAIAHKGMAFPVAWSTLSEAGSSGAGEQTDVLERFLKVVDSEELGLWWLTVSSSPWNGFRS